MKIIANILLVIGVCVAAVGAAGFHDPAETGRGVDSADTESLAWPLFAGGMIVICVGGFIDRAQRKAAIDAPDESGQSTDQVISQLLTRIRDDVAAIDDRKSSLSREELCRRVDVVISGDFFDLVDKHEDFMQMLGFTDYAKVWDGVATAERQLARVWSVATDGHLEEAIQNLPSARQNLDRAVGELNKIWPSGIQE